MTTWSETSIHRRQIEAFIRAEPITVVLLRPQFAETAAGGKVAATDLPLPPQLFRRTPFKRRLVNDWALSYQGEEVKTADWVLHGKHDADIQVDDYFDDRDHRYTVIWVNDHNLYRTAAGLKVRGRLDP